MSKFVVPEPSYEAAGKLDAWVGGILGSDGSVDALATAYAVDVPGIVRAEVEVFFRWWTDSRNFGGINDTRTNADYFAAFCRQRFGEPPATERAKCACTGAVTDPRCIHTPAQCYQGPEVVGPSRGEPKEAYVLGTPEGRCAIMALSNPRKCLLQPGHDGPHKWEAPSCYACSCASCGAVRDFVESLARTVWAVDGYWGHTQHGDSVYVSATGGLRDAAQAVVVAARRAISEI